MLISALLSRAAVRVAATACPRRPLCTAFRSNKFETQPPADKQTVDDLIDGYDLSLSGEVSGDMPEGRVQRRILTGELRHHNRDGVSGKGASMMTSPRRVGAAMAGDYEAFYHTRLSRVRGYEEPRQVASDFLKFNTIVYPPRLGEGAEDSEDSRLPAETCVEVGKIAIDPKALLLFGIAVQGMSVQPALDKLRVLSERPDGRKVWRKFGHLAPLCLAQAIEAGIRQLVNEESVEFETDAWIETVQVSRDGSYTVMRKNARWTLLQYKRPYSVLRIRLREGRPPAFYHPSKLPGEHGNWLPNREIMQREVDRLRAARIYRQM